MTAAQEVSMVIRELMRHLHALEMMAGTHACTTSRAIAALAIVDVEHTLACVRSVFDRELQRRQEGEG